MLDEGEVGGDWGGGVGNEAERVVEMSVSAFAGEL